MRCGAASLFVLVVLFSACSVPGKDGQRCGTWQATVADPRVAAEQLAGPTDAHCTSTFNLTGNTKVAGVLGGYTLELSTANATRMRPLEWSSIPANHPEQLIPGRITTLHLTPDGGGAELTLIGDITAGSLKTDASLFLIRSALNLINLPGSCIIPAEVILGAATSTSATLAPVGDALVSRDIAYAAEKLHTLSDAFLTQAVEYLRAQAPRCALSALVGLVANVTGFGAVAFAAKTAIDFAAWAGAVFQNTVAYKGQPVRITASYPSAR